METILTETRSYEFSEEERQMILLSLAWVSIERPGWDWFLGMIAERLRGGKMFERFKGLKPNQIGGASNRYERAG